MPALATSARGAHSSTTEKVPLEGSGRGGRGDPRRGAARRSGSASARRPGKAAAGRDDVARRAAAQRHEGHASDDDGDDGGTVQSNGGDTSGDTSLEGGLSGELGDAHLINASRRGVGIERGGSGERAHAASGGGANASSQARVALGLLTQSKASPRYLALAATWLPLFDDVMVFESHTDVARVQQIWKYVPQRLYQRFPSAAFYLIMDDDVFINRRQLLAFIRHRDPNELAIYGAGFCDWGVRRALKERIATVLDVPLPDFIHIFIGGIMLFTSAAVRRFSDATMLMQCIDDLETLYTNHILLMDGLKESAMYNQDWLFCWCLQVRMGGKVYLDNTFEDVDFPARKCLTVVDGARHHVGIHHTNPRQMRALWKAYSRIEAKEAKEGNASTSGSGIDSGIVSVQDPSRPQDCRVDATLGRPYAHLPWKRRRRADTLPRPVQRDTCVSALDDASVRESYPHCASHINYVREHATTSPCFGAFGREACEGFQLDRADACNVQYYLFCERLYKPLTAQSWCPPPAGYPRHCCYAQALRGQQHSGLSARRPTRLGATAHERPPGAFLLQVFPEQHDDGAT